MKHSLYSIVAASALFVSLTANAQSIVSAEKINVEITKLLQPYQDANTKANMAIDSLEMDRDHVLKTQAQLSFQKSGKLNTFALNIAPVRYDYAGGIAPRVVLNGTLSTDLTKLMSPSDLNGVIDDFEATLKYIIGDYFREYGDAIVVSAQVSDKVKDAAGNYQSVKAAIQISIDAARLPAGKKLTDIPLKSAQALVTLEVKSGLSMNADVLVNPSYKAFEKGELGLKEMFERILSRDRGTLQQINDLFKQINDIANNFVNG